MQWRQSKNESESPADGTTAVKGIEDSLIKTLGRWGSISYLQCALYPEASCQVSCYKPVHYNGCFNCRVVSLVAWFTLVQVANCIRQPVLCCFLLFPHSERRKRGGKTAILSDRQRLQWVRGQLEFELSNIQWHYSPSCVQLGSRPPSISLS